MSLKHCLYILFTTYVGIVRIDLLKYSFNIAQNFRLYALSFISSSCSTGRYSRNRSSSTSRINSSSLTLKTIIVVGVVIIVVVAVVEREKGVILG